jgi:pre-mRNA-splicing factor ATP-dependent RNA helicase DHX15/PRP43
MAGPSSSTDNPYLAHLPPSQRGSASAKDKQPLYGFMPRKVKGEQAREAMVRCFANFLYHPLENIHLIQGGDINPFTLQPLSAQYKKILEARKKLPVYAKMDEFFQMVRFFRDVRLWEEGVELGLPLGMDDSHPSTSTFNA